MKHRTILRLIKEELMKYKTYIVNVKVVIGLRDAKQKMNLKITRWTGNDNFF
jgi:hypothetical protein